MPRPHPLALAFLPFLIAGCAGAAPSPGGSSHQAPDSNEPSPAPSAAVAESCDLSQLELDTELVVGLAPAERAELEDALRQGPVAVRVEGCKLVVVAACELRATPTFTADPKEGPAEIAGEDDLRRVAPLFADRWTRAAGGGFPLHLDLATAGRFEYAQATIAPSAVDACKGATHLIKSYGVGAYELTKKDGGALEKAGDRKACAKASGSTPPASCGELIAVKLAALGAKPTKPSERGPVKAVTSPGKSGQGAPPGGPGGAASQGEGAGDMPDDDAAAAGPFGPPPPVDLAASEGKGGDGGHSRGGGFGGVGAGGNAPSRGCDPNDPICMFGRRNP